MKKSLLIITQKVDRDDQLLGFFVSWLERFARQFSRVTVLCLQKGQYNLPGNVRIVGLGKDQKRSKFVQLLRFYLHIIKLRNEYDAVFVHMNPIWVVVGAWLWHLLGKRVFLWYTSKGVTLKLRTATWLADVIFTASKESFRIPSDKVIVTGHGIDVDMFKPEPSKRLPGLHILSVGRIVPVKHYEILIDAARILMDEGIDFSVTIAGEPPLAKDIVYKNLIKKKITDAGLGDRFNFIGKVAHRNLPHYYQSHGIFVHMSQTGSLDKTLLEAMSSGMQVASCNDAARAFLPVSVLFSKNNAGELAAIINAIAGEQASPVLRQYVKEHHNLDRLIEKIACII